MNARLDDAPAEVITGSRLKGARPLLLAAPPLILPIDDPVQLALAWSWAVVTAGASFLRVISPGRIVMDARGLQWRTMFSGRRLDWSEIAYAASGSTFRRWSCAYLQLADADGSPAMRRVWIPGFWPMSAAQLADRINDARARSRFAFERQCVEMAPSAPIQTSAFDTIPAPRTAARPAPVRPAPLEPSAPVFGRRRQWN